MEPLISTTFREDFMVVDHVHLGKIVSLISHRDKMFVATEGCIFELSEEGVLTPINLSCDRSAPLTSLTEEESN